jgi:hypothetical protein
MRDLVVRVAALAALLGSPRLADAELLIYSFGGTVDTVVDYSPGHTLLPASIQPGSTFSGTFTFDNAAPGQVSGGDAFYRSTPLQLTATVTVDGQYTFSLSVPTTSDEIDILGNSFGDYKRGPDTHVDFNDTTLVSFISLGLTTTTNVLADAQLSAPSGSSLGISNGLGQPDYYFIGGSVTSLQAVVSAPVPEPGALTLLLSGALAALGAHRRLRRREARPPSPTAGAEG